MRQLTNLFLALFLLLALATILLGLGDLVLPLPGLLSFWPMLHGICLILGAVLYSSLAFNRHLPKRVLLPLLLWLFWDMLGYWPVPDLLGSSARLIIGLVQLLLILALLRHIRRDNEVSPWLVPSQFTGPSFSARNLLIFIALNIVIMPVALLLLGYSAADRLVAQTTAGFVDLQPQGIYMSEKIYRRGDKEIRLAAMVHLASPDYYAELVDSIPRSGTLILAEGVTDNQGLLKNRFDYGNLAKFLGLSSQSALQLPGRVINPTELAEPAPVVQSGPDIMRSDIDLSEFDPRTIEVLDTLADKVLNAPSPVQGYFAFNRWASENAPENIDKIIMNDLLDKRNRALLSYLPQALKRYDTLLIPWGALHMKGLEQALLEQGFTLRNTQKRLSIDFRQLPYERILHSLRTTE